MSDDMPVGPALEQLRELIAILRELGNAGPRDNSFKQWRQVTLTLLQRVWAGDQARAVRFRRIPFSAPSARADAKTVRESFVRGVNEATAYLESLALELEADARGPDLRLRRPPEVAAPSEFKPVASRAPARPAETPTQPSGPIEPSPLESAPPAGRGAADGDEPEGDTPPVQTPPQPTDNQAAAPKQDTGKTATRPRQRLKDMLGFSDEAAAASSTPAKPSAPEPPAASRPPAAGPPATPSPAVPVPAPSRAPVAASAPAPMPAIPPPTQAPRDEAPALPLSLVPTPPPSAAEPDPDIEEYEFHFDDVTDLEESEAELPPTTLREMIDREPAPDVAVPMGAAHEVLAMAAMLDQFGVPKQRRAIVRAALLDLAEQLESPPTDWAAMRQALAFVLDYPQIARRVIPMLVPYLDEAA